MHPNSLALRMARSGQLRVFFLRVAFAYLLRAFQVRCFGGIDRRSSLCCSADTSGFDFARSRGRTPFSMHSAAAVPAACPTTAQVAITRVDVNATCEQLILRPAIIRFLMFLLYSARYGRLYGSEILIELNGGLS